ncbi:MAG: VOC family protein [Bacteroidetes bacterium]|nr:VOC family protein [Bacteroidota bacterium]
MFDIWHIAIPVTNIEESISFYCDFLGFIFIGTDENHNKKQAFIKTPGGNMSIELFIESNSINKKMPDHIAFECDDIETYINKLKSKNATIPTHLNSYDNGVRFFSLIDPQGIPLHFFKGRKLYEDSLIPSLRRAREV